MHTLILTTYKRQGNASEIVWRMRAQIPRVRIVLINNGTEYHGHPPDDLWRIPFNAGPFMRFHVGAQYDGVLTFWDDDVVPTNNWLLCRLAQSLDKADITGIRTRRIHIDPPHYLHADESPGWTNNVKACGMTMHRDALTGIRFPPADMPMRCDDLHASMEILGLENRGYVKRGMESMIENMPGYKNGLQGDPEHYEEREAYCARWIAEWCS